MLEKRKEEDKMTCFPKGQAKHGYIYIKVSSVECT